MNQQNKNQQLIAVRYIFATLKKISLYKFQHPVVQSSIRKSFKLINNILIKTNELTINKVDDIIVVQGASVDRNDPYSKNIISILSKFTIESITFYKGLSMQELELFFKILLSKQESINEKGGITNILSKTGARHLKINQTKFTKVSDRQKIIDKDELYEIPDETDNRLLGVTEAVETDKNDEIKNFETLLKDEINISAISQEDREKIYNTLLNKFNEEMESRIADETKELVSQNKRITFEKKRTETVIQSISDGLVVVDNQGKVLMMNPAAEDLFGNTKESMAGKHIMENIKEEEQMISLSKDLYKDEDGKTVGMVSILTDVTKQKELEQMKSDFLSNVSHELRSPLASIKQTISLILDRVAGSINESQEKFLRIAKKSIERLTRLIDDLLDLSKLEAGKMELKPQTANIKTVIEDTIASLQNWALRILAKIISYA